MKITRNSFVYVLLVVSYIFVIYLSYLCYEYKKEISEGNARIQSMLHGQTWVKIQILELLADKKIDEVSDLTKGALDTDILFLKYVRDRGAQPNKNDFYRYRQIMHYRKKHNHSAYPPALEENILSFLRETSKEPNAGMPTAPQ